MCTIHRTIMLLPLAVVLASTSGCQMRYDFELFATAKNADNGEPLSGVKVTLNTRGHKDKSNFDDIAHRATDDQGQVTHQFSVDSRAFESGKPTWYLNPRLALGFATSGAVLLLSTTRGAGVPPGSENTA